MATKIDDMERKMLEGNLLLVGDDGVPFKPVNADSQATVELFPSMSESFGSPNSSAKLETTSASNEPNKGPILTTNIMGPGSFAKFLKGKLSRKSINFLTLVAPASNGADIAISMKSVRIVHERICNTMYGFFLGKRVAYLVVESYVKNTLSKYGLVKSMMTTEGMFFFKFSSKDGMNALIENGPWLIQNVLLILKKWTPSANIMKDDVCIIPSWGRSNYARAIVELRADAELKDTLVVAVPKSVGEGYTIRNIHVQYEWKPPGCSTCKSTKKTNKAPRKPKVPKANNATTSTMNSFETLSNLVNEEKVRETNDEGFLEYEDYDGYSGYEDQVKFLRSKDETLEAIIKCIKNIQVRLNSKVRNVRTDNGTEFVNHTLHEFYENIGITHQTSVTRTPQQNDIVERGNQTLVEAAHTMLIFSKDPLFLWAEAINTACYTQNRLRYNKTPYELMHDKNPDLSFLRVFGSLCYPTNDSGDLGKLNTKADIGIFAGYAPAKESFRIYNRRTRKIMETIHVTFDELTVMASEQFTATPRAVDIAGAPSSTFIDHDAPSTSSSSTSQQQKSSIISQGVEEPIPNAPFDNPCHEPLHEISTSQESSSNGKSSHPPLEMIYKWTKDHPLENMIGNPS
ncbi:retrovirus-related pol polyprotein from transposon TNT 1-94 [Tanacetum coccineum]